MTLPGACRSIRPRTCHGAGQRETVSVHAAWLERSADPELLIAADPGSLTLCVPKTLSTLCDQAVFVDEAAGVSLSPDTVPLEIDRFR